MNLDVSHIRALASVLACLNLSIWATTSVLFLCHQYNWTSFGRMTSAIISYSTSRRVISRLNSVQPEGETSYDKIASRLWGTMYSLLLFGMPRLIGGLEVLGRRYENSVTVHKVVAPYKMGFCPHARAALLAGNTFIKARLVASGLREMHRTGVDFLRLRRGFLAWVTATRTELGDGRLHQFIRAVEAIVKPEQSRQKTNLQIVLLCSPSTGML